MENFFSIYTNYFVVCFLSLLFHSQSRTQSPRAFWPAGERPERLWDNRLHFPRKRGFRSYYVCLSLTGNRKEKTVNSRNGGFKVFEKQEFWSYTQRNWRNDHWLAVRVSEDET